MFELLVVHWLETLLLNAVQSAAERRPRAVEVALGKLKVCVEPLEVILKSVPAVLVANVCVVVERPFNEPIFPNAAPFQKSEPPWL